MKRKDKIVLTSLVSLVVGAVALYAFSLHESFSEYAYAFLLIEGEEDIVLSQNEFEKTLRVLENGSGEINKLQKMKNLGLYQLMDTSA